MQALQCNVGRPTKAFAEEEKVLFVYNGMSVIENEYSCTSQAHKISDDNI